MKINKRLENKVIIITGAGSGIGQATARKVASEGAKLALVDLNDEALQQTKQAIEQNYPQSEILTFTADVSDEPAVENYIKQTVDHFQKIDGLFNNAGVEDKSSSFEDYETAEFSRIIQINLMSVFYGLKHALKIMKKQGFGTIVNTASVAGIRGVETRGGYNASKHGVVGLTKNAGLEYGKYGINVNAVAPGAIMTALAEAALKQRAGDNWQEAGEQFIKNNPMQRFGTPEEVAHLVTFLLSDEAKFINATVIPIDGGQSNRY